MVTQVYEKLVMYIYSVSVAANILENFQPVIPLRYSNVD